jgi:hypothetical protein
MMARFARARLRVQNCFRKQNKEPGGPMQRALPAIVIAVIALVLAGCAGAPTQSHVSELRRTSSKIVLMPLDVELSEVSAGGVNEPKAEWTHAAVEHLTQALREERKKAGFELIELPPASALGEDDNDKLDQLNKLHGIIGRSIMVSRVTRLPNKPENTKWTLGEDTKVLAGRTGAGYALFVFMRDSYASDGRKVAMAAAALVGVSLVGGHQTGFASLVDLETGDVVWFNQVGRSTGDLRSAEPARETMQALLTGFPK